MREDRVKGPPSNSNASQTKLCQTFASPLSKLFPLNITLGQHKRDNNNRMILINDVFCVLLGYKWTSNLRLQ
jgi:hypothetical protein